MPTFAEPVNAPDSTPLSSEEVSENTEGLEDDIVSDKAPDEAYTNLLNFYIKNKDLVSRPCKKLVKETAKEVVKLFSFEHKGVPKVWGAMKVDGDNTKVDIVDITDESVQFRMDAPDPKKVQVISGGNYVFACNGTNKIYQKKDGAAVKTTNAPYSANCMLYTNSRLIVAGDGGAIASNYDVSSLNFDVSRGAFDTTTQTFASGTSHAIYLSVGNMLNIQSITKFGKYIVLANSNTLQLHILPTVTGGARYIALDVNTLAEELDKVGVSGNNHLITAGGRLFGLQKMGFYEVKLMDGVYKADIEKSNYKNHIKHDYEGGGLVFDSKRKIVFILGQKTENNDYIQAFHINIEVINSSGFERTKTDALSEFKGLKSKSLVYSEEIKELVGLDIADKKYFSLSEKVLGDYGKPIEYSVKTKNFNNGLSNFYKKSFDAFIEVMVSGKMTIQASFFVDTINMNVPMAFEVFQSNEVQPFSATGGHPSWGHAPWGYAGLKMNDDIELNEYSFYKKYKKKYWKFGIGIKAKTINKIVVRRIKYRYTKTKSTIRNKFNRWQS